MQWIKTIRFYLTLLVVAFPVLLPWPVTYVIAAWMLVSLIYVATGIPAITKKQWRTLALNVLPFIMILMAALIYPARENTQFLFRSMALLAFPLGFILSPQPFTRAEMNMIKRVFIAATTGMIIFFICWWAAFGSHFDYGPERSVFYIIRTEFNIITKIHPGYASMYIGLALLFVLEEWVRGKNKRHYWWPVVVFFAAALFALMARLPMVIIFVAILFWMKCQPEHFLSRKQKLAAGIFSVSLVMALILFQAGRFTEFKTLPGDSLKSGKENSLLVRKGIFECAVTVFKEHFWKGTGPGRVQPELDYCYTQYDAPVFSRQHFNTHNQYLDYGISYGAGGLVVLLVVLFVPFYQYRHQNIVFVLFQLILVVCLMGENILSRQAGIIFYAFFNALFWRQSMGSRS